MESIIIDSLKNNRAIKLWSGMFYLVVCWLLGLYLLGYQNSISVIKSFLSFPRWCDQDERGRSLRLLFQGGGVGGRVCCLSFAAEDLRSNLCLLVGLKCTNMMHLLAWNLALW